MPIRHERSSNAVFVLITCKSLFGSFVHHYTKTKRKQTRALQLEHSRLAWWRWWQHLWVVSFFVYNTLGLSLLYHRSGSSITFIFFVCQDGPRTILVDETLNVKKHVVWTVIVERVVKALVHLHFYVLFLSRFQYTPKVPDHFFNR